MHDDKRYFVVRRQYFRRINPGLPGLRRATTVFEALYNAEQIEAPWIEGYAGGLDNEAFSFEYVNESRPDRVAEMDIYDFTGATVFQGGADSFPGALNTVGHEIRHLEPRNIAHWKAGGFRATIAQAQATRFGNTVVTAWLQWE